MQNHKLLWDHITGKQRLNLNRLEYKATRSVGRPKIGPIEACYEKIGANIAAARKAKGWTQEKLGSFIDVAASQVSIDEKAKARMSIHRLVEYAQALGTPIGELFR